MQVLIDTSVLVGLINPRDVWHTPALALHDALHTAGAELLYTDCVVTEAISAAVRRLHEKGRGADVATLLDRAARQAPLEAITWLLPDVPRLYSAVLDLIRTTSGAMNFNDALIALACRERLIPAIASFDADFDAIAWLKRLHRPADVTP